ncbi:hypothetical protein VE01_00760 [Pseudogymnoascus verrucosus]|uniref:Uncharacterized protein n=1 Tax=Pseudogymnoascus verrucosus TaxID=342668 RepID=A0A2P2SWG0_9PEZI|nr:uncharacterized protein VE01_00760 [Pseudogymnoascus verrucosus]OBU01140.1 hypothetical protein VE01_00760 [Pseudogymnoascus verrucosus]
MCKQVAIRYKGCNCVIVNRRKCAIAKQQTFEAGHSIWCKGGVRNLEEFARCERCRTYAAEQKQKFRKKVRVKPTTQCFCI